METIRFMDIAIVLSFSYKIRFYHFHAIEWDLKMHSTHNYFMVESCRI